MDEINLFGNATEELVLPTSSTEYENKYDLEKLMLGKKVKVLNIKESTVIDIPNIVINLDKLEGKMSIMQKEAIRAVKVADGEYTLYIYSEKTGLTSFGKTSEERLPIICVMNREAFSGRLEIYRNFRQDSEEVETVDEKAIRNYRLKI